MRLAVGLAVGLLGAVAVIGLAGACGAAPRVVAGPVPEPTPPEQRPKPRPADPREATRAAVGQLVDAQSKALSAGDYAKMAAAYADDAVIVGPRAGQVVRGRAAAVQLLEADAQLAAALKDQVAWSPAQPTIGVAADARAAWVTQTIGQTITGPDARTATLRMTELFVEDGDDAWHVAAALWSAGGTKGSEPIGALPDPGDAVAGDARAIVDAMDAALAGDPRGWLVSLADAHEGMLIGPYDAQAAGADKIAALVDATPLLADMRIKRTGGAKAGLSPSGSAGFVLTNLQLDGKTVHPREKPPLIQVRVLVVYEKTADAWHPVQAHVAFGFPDD